MCEWFHIVRVKRPRKIPTYRIFKNFLPADFYRRKMERERSATTEIKFINWKDSLMAQFPHYMVFAVQELGTKEKAGDIDNPRIVEYHKTTTLKADDDETPWCSSFVNWCFTKAGQVGTRLALARSWAVWETEVNATFDREWQFGDVVVLDRPSGGPNAGHVGFLVSWDQQNIRLLGGNQNNEVNISTYPRKRIIAIRRHREDM